MRVGVLRKAIKDPDIDLDPFPSEDSFSFARYHPPQVEFGEEDFYMTNPQISVHLPQMDNYNFQTNMMEPWDKSLSRVIAHELGHQLTLDEKGFGDLRSSGSGYGGAGVPRWMRSGWNQSTGKRYNESGKAEKDRMKAIANAISSTNTLETPSYHMEFPESSYLANKQRIERQVMPQVMPSIRGSMRPWGGTLDTNKRDDLVRESMPKGVADQRRAYQLVDRLGGKDATPTEKENAFRRIKGVMARQGSNIVNRPLKEIQQAIRREEAHDGKLRTAREKGMDIPSLLSGKTSRGAGNLGRRSGYKMAGAPMDIAFQLLKERRHPGETDPRHAAAESEWYIHGDDDTESLLDRMHVDQKPPVEVFPSWGFGMAPPQRKNLAVRYANPKNRVYHPAVMDAHADEEKFPDRMVHPESKEELVATNPRYGNSELHTMDDALRFGLYVPEEPSFHTPDEGEVKTPYDYAYMPMPTNRGIPFNEETGFTKSLLKERKSPEAFAHKLEYDKKYQKTPKRVKYREQLNTERRKRGIYGKGGKDVSHTQGGKLTLESPHSNRARHFKNRGTLRRVKVVKSDYRTCTACGKAGIISEHQPRCIYCHKRYY